MDDDEREHFLMTGEVKLKNKLGDALKNTSGMKMKLKGVVALRKEKVRKSEESVGEIENVTEIV